MSDELPRQRNSMYRPLRDDEIALMRGLLNLTGEAGRVADLANGLVDDMSDGGMGGIRFFHNSDRAYGRNLIEATYVDSDDVPVSITLSVDAEGGMHELDFFKADFSPLRRYPRFEQLTDLVVQ